MADPLPNRLQPLSPETIIEFLSTGEIDVQGLIPWSSNYTFVVTVRRNELEVPAVYKPRRGERPLWDFPAGSLANREVAAYVVSEASGWMLVPPTVSRDGPHGPGMVQLYVNSDPRENYFTFGKRFPDQFKRMVLFDALINNADRKAGHCLRDKNGRVWAIDHGICFSEEPKLRTVIWQFAGRRIAADLLRDLRTLRDRLSSDSHPVARALGQLLTGRELAALRRRADQLVAEARFPVPNQHERHIPWPPV